MKCRSEFVGNLMKCRSKFVGNCKINYICAKNSAYGTNI
jgi:hypothetical protein